MAKNKSKLSQKSATELDSTYLLKLVLYLIVGAQWIRFVSPDGLRQIPIPIGLFIGFAFALHDHFQIDRKVEYAVLLVAMFVGFWYSQYGINITY